MKLGDVLGLLAKGEGGLSVVENLGTRPLLTFRARVRAAPCGDTQIALSESESEII